MPPAWSRRLAFGAVLLHGALVLTLVARPDPCADVWTLEHHVSGCCANSAVDRLVAPGRDCCANGVFEDRDPGAFASLPAIGPAAPAVVVAVEVAPSFAGADARPDASIPERPPDRAHRTTVLLI